MFCLPVETSCPPTAENINNTSEHKYSLFVRKKKNLRKNFRKSSIRGAFHLFGKTGRSGGKSNGTGLSTGNFSEKKEYLQRYSSFLVFTEMIGKSMFHLLPPMFVVASCLFPGSHTKE